MKLLKKVDNYLLLKCTSFAHAFQVLTGRTNFFIAKMGIILSAVSLLFAIIHIARSSKMGDWGVWAFLIPVCIFLLVSMSFDALGTDEADREAQNSTVRSMIPRITGRSSLFSRMLWLIVGVDDTRKAILNYFFHSFGMSEVIMWVGFSYGLAIFYYFIEVEPRRPQKSLIKKWIDSVLGHPEPSFERAGS